MAFYIDKEKVLYVCTYVRTYVCMYVCMYTVMEDLRCGGHEFGI